MTLTFTLPLPTLLIPALLLSLLPRPTRWLDDDHDDSDMELLDRCSFSPFLFGTTPKYGSYGLSSSPLFLSSSL